MIIAGTTEYHKLCKGGMNMAERKPVKKLSATNTKQEMLDSYNDLLM